MVYNGFNDNFELTGKTAIITGASSGIGESIAKIYAKKGANVVNFDIVPSEVLDEHCASVNASYKFVNADVTKKEQLQAGVDAVIAEFGKIDILVNCAGVGLIDDAENLSEEIWDKTMAINLKGPFLLTQMVGRNMIANGGGKIIFISSQAGVVALDKHIAYGASKAALINMVKVLAVEWAEYGICTNAISPTIVLTPLGLRVWDNPAGEAEKKKIPNGRFAYPDEIGALALYLASEASDMINGANIVIDGGFTIK